MLVMQLNYTEEPEMFFNTWLYHNHLFFQNIINSNLDIHRDPEVNSSKNQNY